MKILIVDDSAIVRGMLKQLFLDREDIEIIGEASNGQGGYDKNLELKPDMIIMDINMPVMNGLEATKKIMGEQPVPILIFSSSLDAENSFEAISAGAVDVLIKPDIDQLNDPGFVEDFIERLETIYAQASKAGVYSRDGLRISSAAEETGKGSSSVLGHASPVIVIGASTGGPLAVREVLKELPEGFPAGIAVVQHLEEGFDNGYVGWLNESTEMEVKLASGKAEPFGSGTVIVAPVNHHLVVTDGKLVLDDGPKILNQKPAVDALFTSAAEWFGDRVIGILLTGMGRDGAEGCRRIIEKGGATIVQDRETSAIFGMPKAAIDLGAAGEILPLASIPIRLKQIAGHKEEKTV